MKYFSIRQIPKSLRWGMIAAVVCVAMTPVWAIEIPDWYEPQDPEIPESAGESSRMWMVVAETGSEGRVVNFTVMPARPYTVESEKHALADMTIRLRREGKRFDFDRDEIDYIRFYTRVSYSLSNEPTYYGYRPLIKLRNGEQIRSKALAEAEIFPIDAFKPNRFRYDRLGSSTAFSQVNSERERAPFSRPVVAMAWSRKIAKAVRDDLIVRFARQESERVFLKWGDRRSIELSSGPVTVEVHAHYRIDTEGPYASWIEITRGTVEIEVNGSKRVFDFHDRCADTINRHQIRGGRFCGKQVRVNLWKNDPEGEFQKFHFGRRGVHFFYNGRESLPKSPGEVNPVSVNVGFAFLK